MKKFILGIVLSVLMLLPVKALAADSFTFTCDATDVTVGNTTTCYVKGTSSDGIKAFAGTIEASTNFSLQSITAGTWDKTADATITDGTNNKKATVSLSNTTNKTDTFDIATVVIKADAATASESLTLSGITYTDANSKSQTADNVSVTLNAIEETTTSSANPTTGVNNTGVWSVILVSGLIAGGFLVNKKLKNRL